MKRTFKNLIAAVLLLTAALTAAGCGNTLAYQDYLDGEELDKELFYENTGSIQAADPSVITVGDTFYLYATNAELNPDCTSIRAWRSKNLSEWEALGPVFVPARDAWAVNNLWAPEVIGRDGAYYMYYSGHDLATKTMKIGVAVSDSPAGPFHELEGEFNGKTYTRTECPFDFGFPAIDPQPFADDDGSVYLYFSRDQVNRESSVFGCKLEEDMVTVTDLTESALIRPSQEWEYPQLSYRWNEAPFVFKREGKYYMTYSANYYENRLYAVGVAVSDSPLSGFEKAEYNPVLAADSDWAFVSGTGHNSIFPSPDGTELWIAYHSHIDVENGGSERKINFDRVAFDGDRMYVCGPSVTPQALPSGCSPYRNLAPEAEIASDGNQEGLSLLTDGIINYQYAETEALEYSVAKKTVVTLTFPQKIKVRAVMIYDSAEYELAASSVSVAFDHANIKRLAFNPSYRYIDEYDFAVKIPGSAAIAEFEEIETAMVRIEFSGTVSINEIVVLARQGGNI